MVVNTKSVQKCQGQTTQDIRSKIIKNNKWLYGIANIKFCSVPFIKPKVLVENAELVKFCQGQITKDRFCFLEFLRLGRQLRPLWVVSMRRRMRIQIRLCPTLMIEETSLVLYRARSKAPIHGTAAYSPHPKGLGWKYRVLPKDTPKFSGSRRIRTRDPSIPSQSRHHRATPAPPT